MCVEEVEVVGINSIDCSQLSVTVSALSLPGGRAAGPDQSVAGSEREKTSVMRERSRGEM